MTTHRASKLFASQLAGIAVLVTTLLGSTGAHAQTDAALEEIVVTAQRRAQSLQQVPISIETISAREIIEQGFRVIEDIEQFSPSVEINESLHEQSITIRGMGNDVANMSVEQSAPMFVDGVHFGRGSMIKTALVDVERIEVLRGPQPVYFGQNATAGAFSIITKKPTDQWEGNVSAEVGNFDRFTVEGGIGGPLNDTWGIRLAGQYDHSGGHLTDITNGAQFPERDDAVGRVTLSYTPSERFTAMFKAEYAERDSQGDTNVICRTPGLGEDFAELNERAVLERGRVPAYDALYTQTPVPDCVRDGFGEYGVQEGTGDPVRVVPGINNVDARTGVVDIVNMARQIMPGGDISAREPLEATNFRLGLSWELDNGMLVDATTGYIDYARDTFEDTDESPFLNEAAFRTEQFDMLSQEITISSRAEGYDLDNGMNIEWAAGVYYQDEELQMEPVITLRANTRRPFRRNTPFQESTWKSAFATMTFNFMDGKASVDIGGRYTRVEKHATLSGTGATWIFNINPDPDGDGIIEATQHRDGDDRARTLSFVHDDPDGGVIVDCGLSGDYVQNGGFGATASGPLCGDFGAGFYTHRWNNRDTPDAWDTMEPFALGPEISGLRGRPGPFDDNLSDTNFDPQFVFRYRPTEQTSVYFKWARAFKAGGFDTSDRGLPDGGIGLDGGQDAFSFKAEYAENFEVGIRGSLRESTIRYSATLFRQEIEDLQVETEIIDLDEALAGGQATGRGQTNAGKQRTQGLEFDATWLASDNFIVRLAGVFQKGEMVEYVGGCTEAEFNTADEAGNGCISVAESEAAIGTDDLAGFIDRSGEQSPRTPDFKLILGLDYERPLFSGFKGMFNTKIAYSDAFTEDTLGFSKEVMWPKHTNLNVNIGIGDQDNTWKVSIYGRNLLDARPEYFAEFDIEPQGILEQDLAYSDYRTWGVQAQYNFR
jgi:outer membrane receptor protein involved in Fe transport